MDLKQAFETAIKGEIEGRELYKAVAEKTDDKRPKRSLECSLMRNRNI